MISLVNAAKRFGPRVLFENVTWMVTAQDRVGLVGSNGSGKTTLMKLLAGLEPLYVYEAERAAGELDVPVLHQRLLGGALGIDEEAVREERNTRYMRGVEPAIAEVRRGAAQAAFLLEPTPIDEMARIAFAGGVMPQKSTDFYPKLLSGLTIYKLER